jgi:tetratricopeptide (TPR) repeat protein
MGEYDAAITDYDAALRLDPKLPTALYGRGLAKLRKGDVAGGHADIAAAQAMFADIAAEFERIGVR